MWPSIFASVTKMFFSLVTLRCTPLYLYILFIPLSFTSQQSKKWSRSKQHWNWSYWTTCTPYAAISTQSFGLSASTCYTTLLSFFLSKCTVGLWFHGITQKVFPKFEMVFCYQNCSHLLWEKIVLVIKNNFWNLRLKAENLQKIWDH